MTGHGHGESEPEDTRVYPQASWLQKRIHGWTFQAYPVSFFLPFDCSLAHDSFQVGMAVSTIYVS